MKPRRLHLPRTNIWQLALVCYWCALFVGTHLSSNVPIASGNSLDKVLHVLAFGVLAILLATAWQTAAGQLASNNLWFVWITIVLYGALDEWTQDIVGRQVSVGDWLADVVGAAAGVLAFRLWHRPKSSRWPRFSLKALFVLLTLGAAGCYFLMLPTLNAKRFAAAMEAKDYAAAEKLFSSGGKIFPGRFKDSQYFRARVQIAPLTWDELLGGERRISVGITYGDGEGIVGCGAEIRSTRSGLRLIIIVP